MNTDAGAHPGELTAVREANEALTAHATDLQRSNAELEQFAYVASHDLQEPLRKVTSFCQLLQRRYGGQLDERADQYIEFAVDGAKRMQVLINDLLAFSRVGRSAAGETRPGLLRGRARGGAGEPGHQHRASRARRSTAGPLPVVRGAAPAHDRGLPEPARQRDQVPRRGAAAGQRDRGARTGRSGFSLWRTTASGSSAEYADRIFVIFQRLHDRATYPGTGIGLAMCRKIIEYFGGRIWLDIDTGTGTAAEGAGAVFRFTLPVLPEYPSLRSQPELPQVQESHG